MVSFPFLMWPEATTQYFPAVMIGVAPLFTDGTLTTRNRGIALNQLEQCGAEIN